MLWLLLLLRLLQLLATYVVMIFWAVALHFHTKRLQTAGQACPLMPVGQLTHMEIQVILLC